MSACADCRPFDTDIVTDYTTGDRICTECGLVVESDFTILRPDASRIAHATEPMRNHHQWAIRRIIHQFELPPTLCDTVASWMEGGARSVKVVCCAMHFCELEAFTYTEVRRLSAAMAIHFDEVCVEIKAIQKHLRHTRDEERTVDATWVLALQTKLVELCARVGSSRENVAKMKKECVRLIRDRPDSLFHTTESIAWAILLEHGFRMDHLLEKSAKSQIRMIHKKLF